MSRRPLNSCQGSPISKKNTGAAPVEENRPEYEDDGTSEEDHNVPGEEDKQRIIEARATDDEENDAE